MTIESVVYHDGERHINLWDATSYFDVIIRNASNQPQQIWPEDCSFGNTALTLEIVAIDGQDLRHPIVVQRTGSIWSYNPRLGVILEPGDTTVREIYLHQYKPGERSSMDLVQSGQNSYVGFPALGINGLHRIRMRAVFENKQTMSSGPGEIGIKAIRVISDTRDYMVAGNYL